MSSGFATEEFLRFSSAHVQGVIGTGILEIEGLEPFPYQVTRKSNALVTKDQNFLISPICFSGASNFNVFADIDRIISVLSSERLAGGFIQTRTPVGDQPLNKFSETMHCYVSLDTRTNYRLTLGLDDEQLLAAMKADSRSRSRKLLKSASSYEMLEIDSSNSSSVQEFSVFYREAATRLGFSPAYQFSATDFENLLLSDLWTLYQLFFDGELIAGSVVCKVKDGYDYTFMAAAPGIQDAGRANLLFLYKHLSQTEKGFLDLGGGIEEGDSLSRFKLGFGALPYDFLRCKFISKSSLGSFSKGRVIHALSGYWP